MPTDGSLNTGLFQRVRGHENPRNKHDRKGPDVASEIGRMDRRRVARDSGYEGMAKKVQDLSYPLSLDTQKLPAG